MIQSYAVLFAVLTLSAVIVLYYELAFIFVFFF